MPETQPLRVVIADETPVVRHLMRFFLEEEGFEVQGETARGDELIELVRKHRPDAVVLNERLSGVDGIFAVPRIRTASPATRIAMCTPTPAEQPLVEEIRGADVYLEEGVGLKDLAFVLRTLCDAPFIAKASAEEIVRLPESDVVPRARRRDPVDRATVWSRFVAAAAVAVTVLAFGLALPPAGDPSSVPPPSVTAPSPEAQAALDLAEVQLVALVRAIDEGEPEPVVIRIAEQLLQARSAALFEGADVFRLDAMIASEVGSKLPGLSPSMAFALRTILGPLIPPGGGMGSGAGSPRDPGNPGARGGPVAGGARGDPPGLSGDHPGGRPEDPGNGGGKQKDGEKDGGKQKEGEKDGGKQDEGGESGGDSGDGGSGDEGSGDGGGSPGSPGGGGKGKTKSDDGGPGTDGPGTTSPGNGKGNGNG